MIVVLFGLVGGVLAGLSVEFHYWLQNYPLDSLHTSGIPAVETFLFSGLAAPITVTHALFVGMLIRKPGAILLTAALSSLPIIVVAATLEPVLLGGSTSWSGLLVYVAITVVGVAMIAEAIRWVMSGANLGFLGDVALAFAIPTGWTLFLLAQYVLPGWYGPDFGILDWFIWLVLSSIWALLVSGLLPALVAKLARRERTAPPVGPSNTQQTVNASVATSVSMEHPKATTALVLGLVGMFAFAPLAPAAWIVASRARTEMRLAPGRYRESGSLTAGLVLGILGTAFLAISLLVALGFVVFVLSSAYRG